MTLRASALGAILALAATPALCERPETRPPWSVAAFGGVMLDNDWGDIVTQPHRLEFEEAGFVGVAVNREVAAPTRWLALEIEGQLVRHFGAQDHWEVNAPIAKARLRPFGEVGASAAFGLGLSMASETPALEIENEGGSQAVMAYWTIELEADLPPGRWSVLGRIHHRSTAYGLFGEEGGANGLALGLRRRF